MLAFVQALQRAGHIPIVVLLGFAVAATVALPGLTVDNGVGTWFDADDPSLVSYREHQDRWGHDERAVVVYTDAQTQPKQSLTRLRALDRAVGALEQVAEARSLASVPTVVQGEADWLDVGPALTEDPESAGQAAVIVSNAAADPLLTGRLVSADGQAVAVAVRLDVDSDDDAARQSVLRELHAQVDAAGGEPLVAGVSVLTARLNTLSRSETARLGTAAGFAAGLVLLVLFRRPLPVLAALGAVALAAVGTLGVMAAAGTPLNLVTLILPTLVAVLGVANSVHMLMRVADLPERDRTQDRIASALAQVATPCAVNAMTTSLALLTLMVAPMPALWQLGVFGALGLAFAWLTSVVLCVWVTRFESGIPVRGAPLLSDLATRMVTIGTQRAVPILVLATVVVLGLVAATLKVVPDTDALAMLRDDDPVRIDALAVETHLGPVVPLEFEVRGPAGSTRNNPELLAAVLAWEHGVVGSELAGWSYSVADVAARLHEALSGETGVPQQPGQLEQALFLYEADRHSNLADLSAPGRVRVMFGIEQLSARGVAERLDAITAAADLPEPWTVVPVGYAPLYVQKMERIVQSQVWSLGLSFVLVFGLIGVLLRSPRFMLLAIPANLLPVLCVLGTMGALGIRLDATTVTAAVLVIGVVVDDTVHFLWVLREADGDQALTEAARVAGRSMIATTLVVGVGFGVLTGAALTSLAWFGALVAVALLAALVADLLVLPAVLKVSR